MPSILLPPRLGQWDVALTKWADNALGQSFLWNRTNCVALAFSAIDAMYGSRFFQWQETIPLSFRRAAALSGRRTTRSVLLHIGAHLVDPPYAQRGDILLALQDKMECAHVCIGSRAVSSTPAAGVIMMPVEQILLSSAELEVFRCPL